MNKISKKERKEIAIQILDESDKLYEKCSAISNLIGGDLFERVGFDSYNIALKVLGLGEFSEDEGVREAWSLLDSKYFVRAITDPSFFKEKNTGE